MWVSASDSCWRSTISQSVWAQGPACGPAAASGIHSVFLRELNCLHFSSWLFQASQQDPQHWIKSTEALRYPGNVGPEFQWHHGNPKRLLSTGTSHKGAVSFSCWEQLLLSYHSREKGLKPLKEKRENNHTKYGVIHQDFKCKRESEGSTLSQPSGYFLSSFWFLIYL